MAVANRQPYRLQREVKIVNELGLHARTAGMIAQIARQAADKVWIIKDGEKVTMEVHWSNDINDLRCFTTGFKIVSSDVKKVKHVSDSGKGLNDNGDIKGHNGWENTQVWDFSGVWAVPVDWDGALPELVGFGGLVIKNKYQAHDMMKVLSWDVVFDEAGTIVVDSAFFPPGGIWTVVDPKKGEIPPKWHGPYKFTVVK